MKTLIKLLFVFYSTQIFAQQFNNFESGHNLDIHLGLDSLDSIWQIGVPQKTHLDSAYSLPYALITDTINTYGPNLNSSFIVKLDENTLNPFPYIQLEWMQKTDLESGVDGGLIETSYDGGLTWSNVFDDPIFRPSIVGNYFVDTLHNGQTGITGVLDWCWMAICWGSNTGELPTNFDEIQIRFTLVSDSVDSNQDGWMLDNLLALGGVVGKTNDKKIVKSINLFPNPTGDFLKLDLNDVMGEFADVVVMNSAGRLVVKKKMQLFKLRNYSIPLYHLPKGWYTIALRTEDSQYMQKFFKE